MSHRPCLVKQQRSVNSWSQAIGIYLKVNIVTLGTAVHRISTFAANAGSMPAFAGILPANASIWLHSVNSCSQYIDIYLKIRFTRLGTAGPSGCYQRGRAGGTPARPAILPAVPVNNVISVNSCSQSINIYLKIKFTLLGTAGLIKWYSLGKMPVVHRHLPAFSRQMPTKGTLCEQLFPTG